MVLVQWHGRLGNQLFQYALGRIIAEDLDYQLNSPTLPGFIATQDKVKGSIIQPIHPLKGPHLLDKNFVYSCKGKKGFVVQGWFQRYEYYKRHKEKLRKWFNRGFIPLNFDEDDLVIHIRRTQRGTADTKYPYFLKGNNLIIQGSYLNFNEIISQNIKKLGFNGNAVYANHDLLPFEWYENIINKIKFNKMYICTDVKDDPYLKYFNKYNPVILSRGVMEDFNTIRSARKLIISISTMSWWAAFLSNAQEIYMPKPDYGAWQFPKTGANLEVEDEDRFRIIEVKRNGGTFF